MPDFWAGPVCGLTFAGMNLAIDAITPFAPASEDLHFLAQVCPRISGEVLIIGSAAMPGLHDRERIAIEAAPGFWGKMRVKRQISSKLKAHQSRVWISSPGGFNPGKTVPAVVLTQDFFRAQPATPVRKELSRAFWICSSEADRLYLLKQNISADRLRLLPHPAQAFFEPYHEDAKEEVRQVITEGTAFFACTHTDSAVTTLILKGFSHFKKRQQSLMKLAIFYMPEQETALTELVKNYRFRESVILRKDENAPDRARILASAYAYINAGGPTGNRLVEAASCALPFILPRRLEQENICSGAAFYFDADERESIAEEMMRLYKEESRAREFSEKARLNASFLSWDKSAAAFEALLTEASGTS